MASLALSSLPVFLSKGSYVFVGSTSRTTLYPRINIYKIYLHRGLKRNPKGINVLICSGHGFPDSQGWGVGPARKVTIPQLLQDRGDLHARVCRSHHLQAYLFGVLVWSCLFCILDWACVVSAASLPWIGEEPERGTSPCEEFRGPEPSVR